MLVDQDRMSITRAAQRCGVCRSTLLRWATIGIGGKRLSTVKVGGRRYVLVADLETFLDALQGPGDNANGNTAHQS